VLCTRVLHTFDDVVWHVSWSVSLLPVIVLCTRVLHTFDDVVWHVSWSVSGNILAVSGGDNKVTGSCHEVGSSLIFLSINQ
jgi:hypothetical protein